jgi:hypothetical protein
VSGGGLQVCNSADFPSLLVFDALPISGQSPDTDTASQSVQGLVSALISALETYQAQNTPPTFNSTADFAAPEEDTGAEPEPVIDAIELADAGL